MNQKKILIIEDEQSLQAALRKKLEIEGLEVLQAFNGEEGLKILKEKDIDLILLDIIMPVMNGLQMLREIKKLKKLKNLKIIVLTNLAEYSSAEEILDSKQMEYLVKSNYTLHEITEKIKASLID